MNRLRRFAIVFLMPGVVASIGRQELGQRHEGANDKARHSNSRIATDRRATDKGDRNAGQLFGQFVMPTR